MSAQKPAVVLNLPPRTHQNEYDSRELERWFNNVYRYMKENSMTEATVQEITKQTIVNYYSTTQESGAGDGSEEPPQAGENKKRRYLRWMQI